MTKIKTVMPRLLALVVSCVKTGLLIFRRVYNSLRMFKHKRFIVLEKLMCFPKLRRCSNMGRPILPFGGFVVFYAVMAL